MDSNFNINDQVIVRTPIGRNTNRTDIGHISAINGSKATVKLSNRTTEVPLTSLQHTSEQFGQARVHPNPMMRVNRIYLRK